MGRTTRYAILIAAVHPFLMAGSLRGDQAVLPDVRIELRAASFDPLRTGIAETLGRFPEAIRSLKAPDHLVIIQFDGPPLPEWLERVRKDGATIFDYVPRNAYLARLPPEAMRRTGSRPFVRAVVPYLPAFRVDPDLAPGGDGGEMGPVRLILQAAPDRYPAGLSSVLRSLAPSVALVEEGRHPGAVLAEVEIEASSLPSLLPRLVSIPDLFWIEERRPVRPANNEMKWVMQTAIPVVTRLFSQGLTGREQIVAGSDTGLYTDHCFFQDPAETVTFELIDPDSPPAVPLTNPDHRKVLAYQYHSGSNTVDDQGHGTHVAGTAAGDDLAHPSLLSDPGLDPFDGMAPGARLVFQDIDRNGGLLEVPLNLYGFVEGAFNAGARIHTNSWGADTNAYTSDATQLDRFSWDHPDMLFLFAAGNDGPSTGSVNAPASAKNVIAVGMVQTPASGDPNDLEKGSANGPTSDGRRKPEVVNVGGFPIRSAEAGTACGIFELGGTSMATPGVAGGAALVRQYLSEGYYPHGYAASGPGLVPSAALLKAVVVSGAINITGANVDAPIPDNSQGWGRVLLDDALFFPNDERRLLVLRDDDLASASDGFAVGATASDSFQVFNCRQDVPLRATLVWTEPPVAPTSGQAWANDLNLEVVAPGGTLYRGNVFESGVSVPGGTADDRNNVEQVLIPAGSLSSGTYTVAVVPADVAVSPQPYALLVTGDVSTASSPRLTVTSIARSVGCDGDPFLDENETLEISYTVQNDGCGDAGTVEAQLTAITDLPAGIAPASATLGPLPQGASDTVTFQVSLGDTGGACGGEIAFLLRLQTQDGARWEHRMRQSLRLDPATGSRTLLDDVESGDRSIQRAAAWQINTCMAASPARSWHMGDADCSGIPRDASAHSLVFEVALAPGEDLASASFVHAFDGYSNDSFADSIHFEIDHDLDGAYDRIASWTDGTSPTSMTPAGPYDQLSLFNEGRAASVRFRFLFQSAALWVGPNQAPGWSVDDFRVDVKIFALCDVNSKQPPGDVGDSLRANASGLDLELSWTAVPDAATYRVLRSEAPDLTGAEAFSTTSPPFIDAGALQDPRTFFYKVFAVSACGVVSAD